LINTTGNTVTGNQIGGNPNFGINNRSTSTVISGNFIETSFGSLYNGTSATATVEGNRFLSTVAVEDVTQGVTWRTNTYTGTLSGIAPQLDTKLTTTARNALVTKYAGLRIFDTTVNKESVWNGSAWTYNLQNILGAGSTAAGSFPVKYTSGALMTAPEIGAVEFLTDKWYGTVTTGTARREFVMVSPGVITSGAVTFGNSTGTLSTSGGLYFDTSKGGSLYLNTLYGAGTGNLNVTGSATASGVNPLAMFTAGAHTAQTASTELIDFNVNLSRTLQFATGAKTKQRAAVFSAPTYSAVGASVITDAATLTVTNAPAAGTNVTITNPNAFWVEAGATQLDGRVKATSTVNLSGIPTYADNAAAVAGSLPVGELYKTSTGEIRIRY
jgi:hypothetical protein